MPDCEAKPGWSCLVEAPVPRKASRPPAWLPAMPSAFAARSASSPISRAATSAEEKTPATAVACSPRAWNPCGAADGDPAHRLVADDRCLEHLLAGGSDLLPDGERGRQHHRRGMHQPAGVGVVEVQRVQQGAVGERGGRSADTGGGTQDIASAGPPSPSATSTAGRTVPERIPPIDGPDTVQEMTNCRLAHVRGHGERPRSPRSPGPPRSSSSRLRLRRLLAARLDRAEGTFGLECGDRLVIEPEDLVRHVAEVLVALGRPAVRRELRPRPGSARPAARRCHSAGVRSVTTRLRATVCSSFNAAVDVVDRAAGDGGGVEQGEPLVDRALA